MQKKVSNAQIILLLLSCMFLVPHMFGIKSIVEVLGVYLLIAFVITLAASSVPHLWFEQYMKKHGPDILKKYVKENNFKITQLEAEVSFNYPRRANGVRVSICENRKPIYSRACFQDDTEYIEGRYVIYKLNEYLVVEDLFDKKCSVYVEEVS